MKGLCELCKYYPCESIIACYSTFLHRDKHSVMRQLSQNDIIGEISIDVKKCPMYSLEECETNESE